MHGSMNVKFILKPVRFGQSPYLYWNGSYRKHQIKLLYWHKSASSNRPITVRSLPFAGVSVFTSLRGACYCCCSLGRPAVPVRSLDGFCTKHNNGHFYRKKNQVILISVDKLIWRCIIWIFTRASVSISGLRMRGS